MVEKWEGKQRAHDPSRCAMRKVLVKKGPGEGRKMQEIGQITMLHYSSSSFRQRTIGHLLTSMQEKGDTIPFCFLLVRSFACSLVCKHMRVEPFVPFCCYYYSQGQNVIRVRAHFPAFCPLFSGWIVIDWLIVIMGLTKGDHWILLKDREREGKEREWMGYCWWKIINGGEMK